MSIPLKPLGREDIRRLESALIAMALFDKETIEALRDPHERVTWVDSLYTAAAALAREKAGMPISKIAEELGVTEATVRRHLRGESRAGQIVAKVYERLAEEGLKLELPEGLAPQRCRDEELKQALEAVRGALKEALDRINAVLST
ncbi:MAG: helix-turn-helix domain-containing protein [Thermoproteus sp. AZ2]|jgi:probable regulatory domain-containing protein|uniref:Helix-turn-helix domain-containing protein n=1 Tax=Thermoproteus sp. AZ2 TaxID=1609232 RepID=A0ACC6V1T0_9CREN|nr:MAG: regulator [Thermoproteus sp. AZ2]